MNRFIRLLAPMKGRYVWQVIPIRFGHGRLLYAVRGYDRNGNPGRVCPLCAIGEAATGRVYGLGDHREAGMAAGLTEFEAREAMWASDTLCLWDRTLRREILRTLGLEEHPECDTSIRT